MLEQVAIAATGVVAIFLTQSHNPNRRRYACLFGMASQPFWFYAAWSAGQWGILFLNCFYAVAWGKGIWLHWLDPKLRRSK
jgi:multisubunit Na+/H+ antiporter MnhB subunit